MNPIADFDMNMNMDSPVSLGLPFNGSWTLPAIVKASSGRGLANVSRETLEQCLQPVLQGLASVDAEDLLNLERLPLGTAGGAHMHSGIHVRPIHQDISPTTVQDCVRYVHISEVPGQYSMGIFIFPPNTKIPLHDHPGMCVLSRVLYGDLQRLSLDLGRDNAAATRSSKGTTPSTTASTTASTPGPGSDPKNSGPMEVDDDDTDRHESEHSEHSEKPPSEHLQEIIEHKIPKPTSSWLPSWAMGVGSRRWRSDTSSSSSIGLGIGGAGGAVHHNNHVTTTPSLHHHQEQLNGKPAGSKVAYKHQTDHLHAPDTTALYPFEGNLHEFVSGPNGAAVLDVLFPPYDVDHHRDCTFYEIHAVPHTQSHSTHSTPQTTQQQQQLTQKTTQHSPLRPRPRPSPVVVAARAVSPSMGEPCLIVPTGQPEDFHCISGTYGDLSDSM
jgi:hypothetical protein